MLGLQRKDEHVLERLRHARAEVTARAKGQRHARWRSEHSAKTQRHTRVEVTARAKAQRHARAEAAARAKAQRHARAEDAARAKARLRGDRGWSTVRGRTGQGGPSGPNYPTTSGPFFLKWRKPRQTGLSRRAGAGRVVSAGQQLGGRRDRKSVV